MNAAGCSWKAEFPLKPEAFSRLLLDLHRSASTGDLWRGLVQGIAAGLPLHSLSLYFHYFEMRDRFRALHYQPHPGQPRPWQERRRVSPTPAYLRAHVGKKAFGSDELLANAPERIRNGYFRQVMEVEGWHSLHCLVFWREGKPSELLVARRTARQGALNPPEIAFLESLHGHLEIALGRIGSASPSPLVESLTRCEREVVMAAHDGLSNKEIAMRFGKTEATVKAQLSAAFAKLRIRRRSQLAPCLRAGS